MKTIAGVALAAVMACGLGGVEKAEAARFNYTLTDLTVANSIITLSGVYDDLRNQAFVHYNIYDLDTGNNTAGNLGFAAVDFKDIGIYPGSGVDAYNLTFTLPSGQNVYEATYAYDGVDRYNLSNLLDYDKILGVQGLTTGSGFPSFSLSVAAVPLPASAPLFGAAILALGGIGYARRRAKIATAP